MICDGCRQGAHCGPPGVAGPHCPCQHRPGAGRPTPADVDAMIGVVADAVTEAARADLTASPAAPGTGHPDRPTPTPEAAPDAGTDAPRIDDRLGFVSVLTEWMHEHRAGRFGRASVLRRSLVAYLSRTGSDHD